MIIKSSQRSNGKQLANHLVSQENEKVTLINSSGVFSSDVAGSIQEMEALAKGSRARKPLFHVSVSPEESAKMTEEDWKKSWAVHDKIHGLAGLQYIEVQHKKNGRTHRHRCYNRVDPETLTARNLGWSRIKNERIARQLEVELAHSIITGKHNRAAIKALQKDGLGDIAEQLIQAGLETAPPTITSKTHSEWQLQKRGVPIDQVRELLAAAWQQSDNPQSFAAALKDKGFLLAQGDKVPVVVGTDGKGIPLLRAINAARKKQGHKPIKEADLSQRLASNLRDVDAVKEDIPELQKENKDMNINKDQAEMAQLQPAGKAEQAIKAKGKDEDKPEWLQFREKMLFTNYGAGLEGSDLAKYWKVERGEDGLIRFSNKIGEVIDRGDLLSVNAQNKNIGKAAAAAVAIALAKGWDEVRATGSDEFKTAIFKAAKAKNLTVILDSEHDRELWLKLQEPEYIKADQGQGDILIDAEGESQVVDMEKIAEKYKELTGDDDLNATPGATATNHADAQDQDNYHQEHTQGHKFR